MTDIDMGVTVGRWNDTLRRARIGRERKGALFIFSSYADPDGTGIHCGVARFAIDCEIGYSTARRYLAWMREVGLIELVKAGNQRKGLADEYRLILGPDVLEHLDVPDPSQYRGMRNEIRDANRAASAERTRRAADLRSRMESADPADACGKPEPPESPSALTVVSAEVVDLRSSETPSALTQDEPPPPLYTSLKELTSPTRQIDLRTAVTVVGYPQAFEDHYLRRSTLDGRIRPPPRLAA